MYSSISSGLIRPQLRSTIFFCGLKNGMSCQEGIFGIAGAVADVRGEVVPLLDLAQRQVRR